MGYGKLLLNEYINTLSEKYPQIKQYELVNVGGIFLCKLYYDLFTQHGFNVYNYNKGNKMIKINNREYCDDNDYISMVFTPMKV